MGQLDKQDEIIIRRICAAIQDMSDFERGYLLGVAESKAAEKNEVCDTVNGEELMVGIGAS